MSASTPSNCRTFTHKSTTSPPPSQPCLQRNRRNYRVLRLWLLQARPWGSNISTSIPFPSSFLATQAPFILLYRSCLDHSQGLRLGGKLYQLNDQKFSTSYISHGIKGNPRCVNGADTHLHTHVGWQSEPNGIKRSGSQYAISLGEWNENWLGATLQPIILTTVCLCVFVFLCVP